MSYEKALEVSAPRPDGADENIPPPMQPGAPIVGQYVAYAPPGTNQPVYGMPSQPGYGYAPVMQ